MDKLNEMLRLLFNPEVTSLPSNGLQSFGLTSHCAAMRCIVSQVVPLSWVGAPRLLESPAKEKGKA